MNFLPTSFITYMLYAFIVVLLFYVSGYCYRLILSDDVRKQNRLRIMKEVKKQQITIESKKKNTEFQNKLYSLGYKKFSVIQYQLIRYAFIGVIGYVYFLQPYTKGYGVNLLHIAIYAYMIYGTSIAYTKLNLVHFLIDDFVIKKQKKKENELMILFAMIQSELDTMKNQEVNTYHLLKECLGYFDHINHAIIQYLALHKDSPKLAKEAFSREIGGDNAEIFSNYLYQLDNSKRDDALDYLDKNANLFSVFSNEKAAQANTKKDITFSTFFLTVSMFSMFWMIMLITNVVLDHI